MQVAHDKFIRRHLGIFSKPIETPVFNDFQNLLANKQEHQSSHDNENNGKNKVIPMHHLFIVDTINIL